MAKKQTIPAGDFFTDTLPGLAASDLEARP
jgi:hypothetical protein